MKSQGTRTRGQTRYRHRQTNEDEIQTDRQTNTGRQTSPKDHGTQLTRNRTERRSHAYAHAARSDILRSQQALYLNVFHVHAFKVHVKAFGGLNGGGRTGPLLFVRLGAVSSSTSLFLL